MRFLLIALLTLFFMPPVQAAEFDIYQSGFKPLHLAWMVAAPTDESDAKQLIHDVVRHDLNSSRSFSTLDPLSFLDNIEGTLKHVEYADWRIIGADILAVCQLKRSGKRLQAQVQVYDPFRSKLLSRFQLTAAPKSERTLAHAIANRIYQTATGIPGYFNSHILYVRKHGDLADLIYMDQDGANKQTVGRNFTLLLSPDWSPNNQRVALNTYVGDRPRLEIFDLATGRRRTFGAFKGLNSTPEWSPDGHFIAAALSYTGNTEIHLYNTRTKKWRQLTHNPAIDTTPTWSPDGKWIAFTSDRNGTPQIYRIRLSDGEVQRVTHSGSYNTSPSWSPRGDRIALIARKSWEYALATVRADGGDLRYLVTTGHIESPSWSPNGQMLLFSREVKGVRRVYRIPSWGGRMEAITGPGKDASDPAWSH